MDRRITKRMRTLSKDQASAVDLIKSKYQRSRQQEITADSSGILLYQASPFGAYDPGALFDVLAHSHKVFYDAAPGGEFFCAVPGHFQDLFEVIPEELTQPENTYDSTFATHPAIDERRIMLRSMNATNDWTTMRQDGTYSAVRTMAGFELAYTYFINSDHERALILLNGLLADHPSNRFLMELSVKCLQALAEAAVSDKDVDPEVQPANVNDPVTTAFKSALGQMTKFELFASVIHRCAMITDADADHDLRHYTARAASALRSSGMMPAIDSQIASSSKTILGAGVKEVAKTAATGDSLPAGSELDQFAVLEPNAEKAQLDADIPSRPRVTVMLEALMVDPIAASLLDAKVAKVPQRKYDHTDGAHVVIPFILVLDTLGKPRVLEPQRAFALYSRDLEQINVKKNVKVRALSSFGLDSTDTHEYNDFCFYQDQLQAYLTSDGHPLVLDRDQLAILGERHEARYLTLSFVLMTKNRLTFKIARWLGYGFLIPYGPGLVIGSHALLYNYTGRHFTVVYDLWTGKEVRKGYVGRRTYMRAIPKSKAFVRSLSSKRR